MLILQRMARCVSEQHGLQEIVQWRFEVWNEVRAACQPRALARAQENLPADPSPRDDSSASYHVSACRCGA
jgi:hypothetical protein